MAARGASLGTMPDVKRLLTKLLADHRRLLVDLSGIRREPSAQVLRVCVGPRGRLARPGEALYVTRSVPVVADRAAAERRVLEH
jgi:hypothetical protein